MDVQLCSVMRRRQPLAVIMSQRSLQELQEVTGQRRPSHTTCHKLGYHIGMVPVLTSPLESILINNDTEGEGFTSDKGL